MHYGYDIARDGADETVISVLDEHRRVTFITPPEWAGKVVGITPHRDELLVACEYCVFRLSGTALVPVRFTS